MAAFQMEGHPGKRKIQHKQIWHHRRGQIWQYVLHTCTPHTCILVFCLVYMYETFITYNNNMQFHMCMLSCWCWYIYVQLCVFPCWFFLWVYKLPGLIMICLISDGIPEAGEECNFVGYRLASCWCGTLSNGMRWRFMITSDEEKLNFSGFRLAINLQRTSVVLCQVPWDGREYPQKVEEEAFLL